MPRALVLRAADVLTDHPGPAVSMLQRCVALVLIDAALSAFRLGRRLRR